MDSGSGAVKRGNSGRRGSNSGGSGSGNDSGAVSPKIGDVVDGAGPPVPSHGRRPSVSGAKAKSVTSTSSISTATSKNVSLFAHLPQVSTCGLSPTSSITAQLLKSGKEAAIHPAIIRLGLGFADYSVMGASERCKQMLLAFKQVKKEEKNCFLFTMIVLSFDLHIFFLPH